MTMTTMVMARSAVEITDEALVAAALDGDGEAYAALVERYRDVAFAYALARLRHRDEAEDAAQEAFVRAYQSLGGFRASGCWAAWVMRILRNLCTDIQRRDRGRVVEPLCGEWLDDSPTPEAIALDGERRRLLQQAVTDLPEKYRVPVLMHYGAGRTYREIALALGIPESTVVGRLAGALRKLRRRMGVKRW
jgi:RNA polymerase sigma-70 factor, ECF subfamily